MPRQAVAERMLRQYGLEAEKECARISYYEMKGDPFEAGRQTRVAILQLRFTSRA